MLGGADLKNTILCTGIQKIPHSMLHNMTVAYKSKIFAGKRSRRSADVVPPDKGGNMDVLTPFSQVFVPPPNYTVCVFCGSFDGPASTQPSIS